jgi:CCAAT/enhancer binding protein (C/EBP) gamma
MDSGDGYQHHARVIVDPSGNLVQSRHARPGSSTSLLDNNSGKRSFHGEDDEASFSEGSSSNAGTPSGVSKTTGRKRKPLDKGSDEYRRRREKNNEAVKKSRIKSKVKTAETQDQVNELIHENQLLNQKVASLSKEFELLKELYQAHAKNPGSQDEIDLRTLMAPDAGPSSSRS